MAKGNTLRRVRVYAPRVGRMAAGRKLKALCWYMHVPKSGGSSIHEALRSAIPLNQHITAIDAESTRRVAAAAYADVDDSMLIHEDGPRCAELFRMRELQQMTGMAHGDALVYGHCLFSETADRFFGERYRYVTMLRDPIARVISNYRATTFENFYSGNFDAYLESDVGRRHALLNLRYFSGIAEIGHGEESLAMERAKSNQDKFSVIGLLENMEDFIRGFQEVFGARLSIPHYNPAKGNKIDLTRDQLKKLENLCEYDLELHERARKLFQGK